MTITSFYKKLILSRLQLLFYFAFLLTSHSAFTQAPKSYTSSEILLQLKKLNTVGSVLYIAAHPDDENTRLIAYLANEKCLRTGYLSLTRGDGGQNLIGPEQGIELGVIRTQELLAARRIDGGEQFFTRAYDFGYSKSPEETFTKWNKDSILGDMVWVIRNFRPDIIITRFATDGSGGHGHHTASAILAEEAFDAAADPTRFPEQLQYVDVWKTRRMFYNTVARFRDPNADMSAYIPLDVGGYNPLLGKSYGEISAESRSMHKSQGFGSAKQRGEMLEHFKPVKGDTAGLKDIFEGIDFTWKRMKGGDKIDKLTKKILTTYSVTNPSASTQQLETLTEELAADRSTLLRYVGIVNDVIYAINGVLVESIGSDYTTTVDAPYSVKLQAISRGPLSFGIDYFNEYELVGWYNMFRLDTTVQSNILFSKNYIGKTHSKIEISQGFYLQSPIQSNMFNPGSFSNRCNPETIRPRLTNTMIKIGNYGHVYTANTQYKWVDPEKGELYRPVVVTPPVMINLESNVITFSDNAEKAFKITLKAGKDSVRGTFEISIPENWQISCKGEGLYESFVSTTTQVHERIFTSCEFKLNKKGDLGSYSILIKPSAQSKDTIIKISAVVNGISYSKGIKEIKYDHIPVQTLFPEAEVKLVKLDVVKKSKRIGYIPGAGDEVQACLSQLGYEVVTLTDDVLAKENLSQFDAIITGVRAYNTNDKLPSFKQKLMDYVAAGGNLIVQYNTNSWAGPLSSDIGPYKFKITRDRITNEDAKVNMLLPNHPVFNTPNKITDKDFEGWIQERSIYHAGEWDSNYVAPIGMADPNEKENKGALLIGKHGKGNFIYTGLVFFRELPAGVPGAYRLMVNLIELGK